MSARLLLLLLAGASAGGCVRALSRAAPSSSPADGGASERRAPDARVADGVEPARWVVIPAGTFPMGSPVSEPCRTEVEDLHQVTLTRSFEMHSTEVTQAQFQELMGYNPSILASCGPSCPVENVTWHEAAAYCNALSRQRALAGCYGCSGAGASVTCEEADPHQGPAFHRCPGFRLPTDAEWERAYRADTSTAFYNGANDATRCDDCGAPDANADRIAWYCWNASWVTHPVGKKQPNAWGLHDLAGNVREWVNDRPVAGLGTAPVTDPWGAAAGDSRVIRGASHSDKSTLVRGAYRVNRTATDRSALFGFRCVRTLP